MNKNSQIPERAAAKIGTLDPAIANFDNLADSCHVRLPVVCALFGCSPASVWRRVRAQTLPPPRKFSERISAWQVGELRAVLRKVA